MLLYFRGRESMSELEGMEEAICWTHISYCEDKRLGKFFFLFNLNTNLNYVSVFLVAVLNYHHVSLTAMNG